MSQRQNIEHFSTKIAILQSRKTIYQPTMKRATYIFCAFVAVVLASCATPVAVDPFSLRVCRDGLRNTYKEVAADSIAHSIFKRDIYNGETYCISTSVDCEKYNESGYLLRELSFHRTIYVQRGDTTTLHRFNQNVFNENGELIEHYKYTNDTLREIFHFAYNKKGQVVEAVNQYMPKENYVPLKYLYAYDRYGNICEEERYENNVLQWKKHTKYSRKGKKLEEVVYRSDGTIDNKNIYSYNRRGELVEHMIIEERGKIHIMDGVDWELNPFERNYWNKHQQEQVPIAQFDTLCYRTTYHSKGKIATTQERGNPSQSDWVVISRTEYNRKGVPTKKMSYRWSDEEGKSFVSKLTIYNSQGLPFEEYYYDQKKRVMRITSRKEYNESGKLVVCTNYNPWRNKVNLHYYAYDQEGNQIDEWFYEDNGTLKWRTETLYENGKIKQQVNYGEMGVLKSTEVFEEKENGELQSTKYDKDGAIIKTRLSKNTDPCYHVREYDNNGELLIEIRMEHFE